MSRLSHRCFWLITRDGARLPQLLCWLPVRNPTLKHKTGLTEYRASRYFARLPSCLAESGSLALCTSNFLWLPSDPAVGQQRPCHSDYLPLSQGDSGFFQPDGFASFAGQTKKPATCAGFRIWRRVRDVLGYVLYPTLRAPAAAPIVPDDWSNNGGSHPHSTEVLFDP